MFAKLLKHEFKTTCRSLGILSIAALVSGAVGGLMLYFALQDVEDISRNILQTLSNLLLGGIYIGLFIFGAGSSIYLYYNFYKNKFTDEGYLTFTLPASTHQILLSSILNILIWEIILTVVLLLSYLFSVLPALIYLIKEISTEISPSFTPDYPTTTVHFSVWQILVTILGYTSYSLILPLFSITVGSIIVKKHKLLAAFGIGYGVSIAISMLSGFLEVYFMSFPNYWEEYMGSANLVSSVMMLILSVIGYFLMHHFIEKKLNL
jgi:hypothetical protein